MARSKLLRHGPCPSCDSSDANGIYDDGSTKCHKCGAKVPSGGTPLPERKVSAKLIPLDQIEFKSLAKRKLHLDTCEKWKYGMADFKGQRVQVATYFDQHGTPVAQKIRFADKKFTILGDAQKMGLYGQHLWRDGGKKIIVTEGEIDALSVSQVQGNKWPVVSIPNGSNAAKKSLSEQLEWLERYEEVILMFDQDEPGIKAARECSELFTPGKCKLASLPLKDASDCLQEGRGDEIIKAMWDAKVVRPDGIVAGTEMWETVAHEPVNLSIEYPWAGVQNLTHGQRHAEIVLHIAGTGVGKSTSVMEIAYHNGNVHGEKVGILALEQSTRKTALQLMSIHINKRLHVDGIASVSPEELKAAFDATLGSGNYFLYDHWGSTDSENLLSKIRYLVHGCGCTTIILDHLSIVVSGSETDDERKVIDVTMTNLRKLTEELKCRMHVVSHLKYIEGTPHESGGEIKINHIRGSASIKQLSDVILAYERDQQDEGDDKFLTTVRVLKNRPIGENTGLADTLKYHPETGRLLCHSAFDDTHNTPKGSSDF